LLPICYSARQYVEGIGFAPDHKLISPLPFFHIYDFTVTFLYPAVRGNQVITTPKRFELETFCRLVQEHQPQKAYPVPPIVLALQKSPLVDNYDMTSLRMISSAAAPMTPETEAGVKNVSEAM
jgi:4-coumarate--CoA ligase